MADESAFLDSLIKNILASNITLLANIKNLSDATGIATSRLQELQGAALLSGVERAEFDKGLSQFAQNFANLKTFGNPEVDAAFQRIALSAAVNNGTIETISEALDAVLKTFPILLKTNEERLAIASKLFGSDVAADFARLLATPGKPIGDLAAVANQAGFGFPTKLLERATDIEGKFLFNAATSSQIFSPNFLDQFEAIQDEILDSRLNDSPVNRFRRLQNAGPEDQFSGAPALREATFIIGDDTDVGQEVGLFVSAVTDGTSSIRAALELLPLPQSLLPQTSPEGDPAERLAMEEKVTAEILKLRQNLARVTASINSEAMEQLNRSVEEFRDRSAAALADLVLTGEFSAKKLGQVFKQLAFDVARQQLTGLFSNILGTALGLPGRMSGGRVSGGRLCGG